MVVIQQKRFEGQDGRPTHPKLLSKLKKGTVLEEIPHQYYFPKDVLRNLVTVKKAVISNREAYIKSGGGNKLTSVVMIIEGMSGSGKCQTKGSKVLMSDGSWKNIEDVNIGDEVISPNQEGGFSYEKVENTHSRFEQQIYEVWEKNRQRRHLYSCAGNHDCPIYISRHKKQKMGKFKSWKKLEIREAIDLARLKVPLSTFTTPKVEFKHTIKGLDIPAYDLGVWLGDGSYTYKGGNMKITTPNREIIEALSEKPISEYDKKDTLCKMFRFSRTSNFSARLREIGLYNKKSGDKFIPERYMKSLAKDRWELLSGLFDTDGYISNNKYIDYVTKSKKLAEGISFITHSLGGRATYNKVTKGCQNGFEGEYYRLFIKFNDYSNLNLRCLHKRKKLPIGKDRTDTKRIRVEFKKGKPQQVYGFSITGESKFYITDNWVVTHNSTLASQFGLFLDPKMTLEKNYAWNMKRLMNLVEYTYPGMVIIMDEAMIVNSRSANSRENLKLIIALSQIRSKGVFFIFCINSVHQLEKTIPLSRADFLVRIKRIGGLSGKPKFCIYDKDKMKQLIIKNAGKYSHYGVFPNIGWTTFSKYFPFNDIRYDKMKHKESLKNLEPKDKNKKEKKFEIGLTRLIEYCRMNELIRTYEDFHKITDISAITLGTQKNKLYQELEKVNFDKLSALIEGDKREKEKKKFCQCGNILSIKNRSGLCGDCYLKSVKKINSEDEEIIKKKQKKEIKELREIKEKYNKLMEMRRIRVLKFNEKKRLREERNKVMEEK